MYGKIQNGEIILTDKTFTEGGIEYAPAGFKRIEISPMPECDDFHVIKETWVEELDKIVKQFVVSLKDFDLVMLTKIQKLKEYDSSLAVNEFSYNGQSMWFTSLERGKIMQGIASEEALGKTETFLGHESGFSVTLPIEQAKALLNAIEVYAKECYNTTFQHTQNIRALTDAQEVMDYDYTTGYPQKLEL